MPLKARIDMLTTGFQTPVGVKVIFRNLTVFEKLVREIEAAIKAAPGMSSTFAERLIDGFGIDIKSNARNWRATA